MDRLQRDTAAIWKSAENAIVSGDVGNLTRLLRENEPMFREQRPPSSWLGGLTPDYSEMDAPSIIARHHHFEGWDQFAAHREALKDEPAVAQFEAAVDAIVTGDTATLGRLLRENPDLIRARSRRRHHATLLHYAGANGIEEFRQRTPDNAVQVTALLLEAGAEVDAVADMYGGSTTLGLVATSIHPKTAGVQEALLDVLLAHGARMDGPQTAGKAHPLLVNSCLANGRGEAAAFLAGRGAPLDLEGAAGVGRLDIVASFFNPDGSLKPGVTKEQMREGFKRACGYGRTDVAEFLLDHGVDAGAKLTDGVWIGTTGLHLAAFGGHAGTVKALLKRNLAVDAKDETYGTTPLCWALYAWSSEPQTAPAAAYYQVAAALVAAGAKVNPEWLADPKVRADATMTGALSAQMPR